MPRLHILGASGSGTSTLGAEVARLLSVPHVDADAIFWLPTDPPFEASRPLSDRLVLLRAQLAPAGGWVFSGSAGNWAKSVEPLYTLIVYLSLDRELRMERLRAREKLRYGPRIEPEGDMAATNREFLAWAKAYDTAGLEQRSRASHEKWLATQSAPVLRLDSSEPLDILSRAVISAAR